jgi:RHS repeat-associated protein
MLFAIEGFSHVQVLATLPCPMAKVADKNRKTANHNGLFIFANGHRLARRDSSGTVHYYFSDQINSANVITDPVGSLPPQAESDYMPYGGEIVIVADTTGNQYKFTGKERDTETDLDYFGARYYAHSFMRFMTPDWAATPIPIPYAELKNPQTINLYTYVENNPITGTDPDGHDTDTSQWIGNAAGYYDCLVHTCADEQQATQKTNAQSSSNQQQAAPQQQDGTQQKSGTGTQQQATPPKMDDGAVTPLLFPFDWFVGGKTTEKITSILLEKVAAKIAQKAAAQVIKNTLSGSKQAVAADLKSLQLTAAQQRNVMRALSRASNKSTVTVEKVADGTVRVTTKVPGRSGGLANATYEKVIDAGGHTVPKSVVQKGYDAAGKLVHVDPKK